MVASQEMHDIYLLMLEWQALALNAQCEGEMAFEVHMRVLEVNHIADHAGQSCPSSSTPLLRSFAYSEAHL
jgi:hypothetical protein